MALIYSVSSKQEAVSRKSDESRRLLLPSAPRSRGFALLIAVIFMSVMLAFALALGSLGYKQSVLASAAIESQYAFYAADAALECVLFADQKMVPNPFSDDGAVGVEPSFDCGGQTIDRFLVADVGTGTRITKKRFDLDGNRCADITVYKPTGEVGDTYLFAQGYSVSCDELEAGVRFATRGIKADY